MREFKARFALERQAWKEAAELAPRGGQFPQAEAITYFVRSLGSARSGDVAAADRDVAKLKELRVVAAMQTGGLSSRVASRPLRPFDSRM